MRTTTRPRPGSIQYGKSLALELGPYEVNVNVVCPTQMADKSRIPDAESRGAEVLGSGRREARGELRGVRRGAGRDNLFEHGGQPDFREVAEGVLWLVSPRSRLVTGLALPMDAGWIVKRGG